VGGFFYRDESNLGDFYLFPLQLDALKRNSLSGHLPPSPFCCRGGIPFPTYAASLPTAARLFHWFFPPLCLLRAYPHLFVLLKNRAICVLTSPCERLFVNAPRRSVVPVYPPCGGRAEPHPKVTLSTVLLHFPSLFTVGKGGFRPGGTLHGFPLFPHPPPIFFFFF